MKAWSLKWPNGCRKCGSKRWRHGGQGYCNSCYGKKRRSGALVSTRRGARIRNRDGETQFFCHDCSRWKSSDQFRIERQRTVCHDCRLTHRREQYAARKDELNAQRRERMAQIAQEIKLADAMKKRHPDPWARKAIVPMELVGPWLERIFLANEGSWVQVGHLLGISDRRLRTLRFREMSRHGQVTDKVTVDLAERIARAADTMDEMREFLVPGTPNWSPHSMHCLHCGRHDLPHHAKGLCKRCYQNRRYHEALGQPQPPPRSERWATWYHACTRCGRTKFRHQGKGICSGCFQQVRRERSAA